MSSGSVALNDQAGRSIRRYLLIELIGSGSFGAVYSAKAGDSEVAVKLGIDEEKAMEESEILITLQGTKNVPQWLWYGKDNFHYVIVMSKGYLNLDQLRRRNVDSGHQFTKENLQKVLFQSVSVLQAVHEKGVLHRDIKASNLLITLPEGTLNRVQVMVTDFGWAVKYRGDDEEKEPRQLAGLRHCSARVQQGEMNCPWDDLVQLTYTAIALTNDNMAGLFLPPPERLEYKMELLSVPELVLQPPVQWLHRFFSILEVQDTFFPLPYDAIRQAIQDSLPEANAAGDLFLINDNGVLRLP